MNRYRNFATHIFTAIFFFAALNIACWIVLQWKRPPSVIDANPVWNTYGPTLFTVYSGWTEPAIRNLLSETWDKTEIYEPFTEFREAAKHGRYVNVDENGFRRIQGQGPWPPSKNFLNVFFFGGSTAFGYGVADNETIAARIQAIMNARGQRRPVRVYNFGRAYYYSSQERVLFEKLLIAHFIPDIAIFMDGMNDSYFISNETGYSPYFRQYFSGERSRTVSLLRQLVIRLPMIALAQRLKPLRQEQPRLFGDGASEVEFRDSNRINHVIDRYLENCRIIRAVSDAYGVKSIFVWQPVPNYHYDLRYHPFWPDHPIAFRFAPYIYAEMAKRYSTLRLSHIIWLGDLQRDLRQPLYVDLNHYTAAFSNTIATEIAAAVHL